MTILSSFSKVLIALTLVGAGTAVAAPASGRALVKANLSAKSERANRPAQALRGNRQARAQALKGPMMVAQATPAAAKAKGFNRQERHAERIAKFDSNKNGQIDPAERLVMKKQRFTKLDANGDKVITLAELQAAKEAHRKARAEKHAMHPGKEGHEGKEGRAGQNPGKRAEARFVKLDSDKNGSLSWQEFSTAKERAHGPKGEGRGPRGQGKGKGRARF